MYSFIVDLFSEEDYDTLLEDNDENSKDKSLKVLIVPSSFPNDLPFIIDKKEIDNNSLLSEYPTTYFNFNKFINPTHNNANNIGNNSALMSHSPTHYKITKAFINKDDDGKNQQYPNGNAVIKIPLKKVDGFKKSVRKTEYYSQFPELCDRVVNFFGDFDTINPENSFGLAENDFIVFLVNNSDIERYLDIVKDYTNEKILKYKAFTGSCDTCGKIEQLYTLTHGSTFDIQKNRAYLLRHPGRFNTNLKSRNTENFNVCEACSKQIFNFFEYIKKYKLYSFIIPTSVTIDTEDYKDYSSRPIGMLNMLKEIYKNNRSQEFDYIMMITDPVLKNIEFTSLNVFDYNIDSNKNLINVQDIPISSILGKLKSKKGITFIQNKRNKSILLNELNLLFNNSLIPSLFETDPGNLITTLHPFLKLKIIEYNSIIKNFVFSQDASLFESNIFSKLIREMVSELLNNSNLRDEMSIGYNKFRFFLTIYYKYIELEGNNKMSEYTQISNKIDTEGFEIKNDFEASYCMGQIFYYLLEECKGQNKLSLFTKHTMNVHDMITLKRKLITTLEKYSYNKFIDNNRKFHNMITNVLAFEFKESYDNNKMALYTGYFDKSHLYGKSNNEESE